MALHRHVRALALAAVIASLIGGCGQAVPSIAPATATVRVVAQRVAGQDGFFATEHHARLTAVDGTIVVDWRLSIDAENEVRVAPGSYTLSAFTVFLSDFIDCVDDPAHPGTQTCVQPTLGPAHVCATPIAVGDAAEEIATFSILADGGCRLDLGGAAPAAPSAQTSR